MDTLDRANWQAHLIKHPMGVNAIARSAGREPWNQEGWDRLVPPVVTAAERTQAVEAIASLRHESARCEVPEFQGRRKGTNPENVACTKCRAELVDACFGILGGQVQVGQRYATVTEELVDAVTAGRCAQLGKRKLFLALFSLWQKPEALRGLCVLRFGLDQKSGRSPIVRISRSDGVRTEFYIRGRSLKWRTTYRDILAVSTPAGAMAFLQDPPPPASFLGALSETCAVPRSWWEEYEV